MKNKIVYNGASVKGLNAQDCAKIIMKHYGKKGASGITPEQIVKDAKLSKHPLHEYFEWDDAVAADKHRIQQARVLIASLMILNENGSKSRVFHNIMEDVNGNDTIGFRSAESKYLTSEEIFSDENLRSKVLNRAKKEAESFMVRYKDLVEAKRVFIEIEKFIS